MKLNEEIWAVFSPRHIENLSREAVRDIGKTGQFAAAWLIPPGDPYAGQFAMTPAGDLFHFAWCPEEDLKRVSSRPW